MIKFNGQEFKDEEFFAYLGIVGVGAMIVILSIIQVWNG